MLRAGGQGAGCKLGFHWEAEVPAGPPRQPGHGDREMALDREVPSSPPPHIRDGKEKILIHQASVELPLCAVAKPGMRFHSGVNLCKLPFCEAAQDVGLLLRREMAG